MSKATFVIATAGHARHLLGQAEARVEKLQAQYHAAVADVEKYKELAATLPESTGPSKAKKVDYAVGTVVDFNYGRDKTRVLLSGVIKAVADDKSQYLIETGTGFDAKQYKVFGGAIVGVTGASADVAEADPLAPQDEAASAPENGPADDLPFDPDAADSAADPLAA